MVRHARDARAFKTQAVMKTIIAGSRGIKSYRDVCLAVRESGFADSITEVVSGGAAGVDSLGERWARTRNLPVKHFLPDWKAHGKAAGIIRNHQMGDYAQALIAVWDGKSKGTKDMIDYAKKKGLKVFVSLWTEKPKYETGSKR